MYFFLFLPLLWDEWSLKTHYKKVMYPSLSPLQTDPHPLTFLLHHPADWFSWLIHSNCIAGYALSWVIHRIQSEIIIWKPWLVYRMVGYGSPSVSGLVFRPENPPPPFCGNPPIPVEHDRVWEWWWNNLTAVWLVYLAAWAEDGQAIPKNFHVLNFYSWVTVLQENGFRLDLIGIGFCE